MKLLIISETTLQHGMPIALMRLTNNQLTPLPNMKQTILTICLLLVLGHGNGKNVIINPEFDSSTADYMLLFSKIELTDSATIVHANVYNRPNNWIRLPSKCSLRNANGEAYKLLRCEDFELDKKVYMPESGTRAFTLYFEPVAPIEKTVNFYESDNADDWRIYGIKLYNVEHTEPVRCTLKGIVNGRPQSSCLALLKEDEDFRTAKVTYIPIRDGKFEYTLYADAEEAYQLIFLDEILQSQWRPVIFIAESGDCLFTLYSDTDEGWESKSIMGGKHNNAYQSIIAKLNKDAEPFYKQLAEKWKKLEEEEKVYTPEAHAILKQARSLPPDNPDRNALFAKLDSLRKEGNYFSREATDLQEEDKNLYKTVKVGGEIEYAKEHPDIAGYTLLKKNMQTATERYSERKLDVTPMLTVFHDIYEKKYPDHPYTSAIRSYIQAALIKVGSPYPDVAASDVNSGKDVKLSELITGKVALIHLWAAWCGPCRKHGLEMIPVYEKYKDNGFTVVGIAREQQKEAMLSAMKKDNYPWLNLLELNDQHGIWTKYGISYSGGGDFLVDADGNFLAVAATPQEIEKILQELYEGK
jgi:thiol-disulfide isomerase/thioredoxin